MSHFDLSVIYIEIISHTLIHENSSYLGGGDCPGFMFRNVFCHQAGDGIIDDSLCNKDIAGDKPDVAKVCDEEEGEGSGTAGPLVCTIYLNRTQMTVLIY